ncbi:MAG: hypothetical protein UY75_C0034G0010, partial [Parcubacteria group bacterium GW2011_GWC2_52_8c]
GREQQVLALRRQQAEDAADVVDEAHVEHAVGLVEHQDFDRAQVDGSLLHVVEQAARGGDDDVHAAAQLVDLRADADAAENHRGAQPQVLAVGAHAVLHLRRELAGRHQDQCPHGMAGRRRACRILVTGVMREQMQHGQREARGLAGAGLGGSDQIATGEHQGNGLRLDGGGLGIALLGDSAEQLGR